MERGITARSRELFSINLLHTNTSVRLASSRECLFFSLTHRFRDRSEETEEAEPRRADNGNNRNPSVCVCVQKLRKSERAASAIDNHPKLGTAFCVFASYSFCSSQVCLLLCSHRFADHDLLPQRWVFSHLFGLPANS